MPAWQPERSQTVACTLNPDLGGMTIFRAADLEEAIRIGTDDPSVKSGLLNVEVKRMSVPFHD